MKNFSKKRKQKWWLDKDNKPIYVELPAKQIIDKWKELYGLCKSKSLSYQILVQWFDNYLYEELHNDKRKRQKDKQTDKTV